MKKNIKKIKKFNIIIGFNKCFLIATFHIRFIIPKNSYSLLDDILVWTIASPELGLDVGVLEHGHAGVLLLLLGVEPLLLLVVRGAALPKVVVQAARQMESNFYLFTFLFVF